MRNLALISLVVLFFALSVQSAHAAVCEGGVLKSEPGGSSQGTCNVTSGDGTNVTCNASGTLTDASGATVGACAQGDLLRDGLFGCNSSKYANVGSTVAIRGVYVPVNDAAVTLNTGYLVYKECVLDGVNAKISEAARTELTATVMQQLTKGRQEGGKGNPYYVRNRFDELKNVRDRVQKVITSDAVVGVMCPAFKNDVRRTQLLRYMNDRNKSSKVFACSYPTSAGEHAAALKGKIGEDKVLEALGGLLVPGNDPLSAQLIYDEYAESSMAAAVYDREERWRAGNLFYDVTDGNENPFAEIINTPSYLISQGATQVYTSGFRCLEGADELSEVCAPLFTRMVTESFRPASTPGSLDGGFFGMTQSQNGLGSYIGRMVAEAGAAVRDEAINLALANLTAVRQVEIAFLQAKEASANALIAAINKLRGVERTCWEMIAYNTEGPDTHVCASPPQNNRCTTSTGVQINIPTATSTVTQFSQAAIDPTISSLALPIDGDIRKSAAALKEIDELISTVTAGSIAGQKSAISRLDQMIGANANLPDCSPQKTLHTAADAQCANKQRDDIAASIGLYADEQISKWGDDPNPSVGWCNYKNPAVIQKWINEWKQ